MSHPRTFAVLPAAGQSRRMGRPKLLMMWNGRMVIDHVLEQWTTSAVTRVTIVVCADDTILLKKCDDYDVDVVIVPTTPPDMKHSVRLALVQIEHRYAPFPTDAWLLSPADTPELTTAIIDRVVGSHCGLSPRIVVPVYQHRRGHPVLFPWPYVADVRALADNEGINALLSGPDVRELPLDDERVIRDLDTPDDYEALICRTNKK